MRNQPLQRPLLPHDELLAHTPPLLPHSCHASPPRWLADSYAALDEAQLSPTETDCTVRTLFCVAGEPTRRFEPLLAASSSDIPREEGLGSVVGVTVANSLGVALSAGRTLVIDSSRWSYGTNANATSSSAAAWNSLFYPLSSCDFDRHLVPALLGGAGELTVLPESPDREVHGDAPPLTPAQLAARSAAISAFHALRLHMLATARYVHKDVVRADRESYDVYGSPRVAKFIIRPPRGVAASEHQWKAALRAWLVSRLRGGLQLEIDRFYVDAVPAVAAALAPRSSMLREGRDAGSGAAPRCVGIHLRTSDGNAESYSYVRERWDGYVAALKSILGRTPSQQTASASLSVVIATHEEDRDGFYEYIVTKLRGAVNVSHVGFVPQRVRFSAVIAAAVEAAAADISGGDAVSGGGGGYLLFNGMPMARLLAHAPRFRLNASLDALAVADVLSRCPILLGRASSTLFQMTAALQEARGCGGDGDGGLDVMPMAGAWDVATGERMGQFAA